MQPASADLSSAEVLGSHAAIQDSHNTYVNHGTLFYLGVVCLVVVFFVVWLAWFRIQSLYFQIQANAFLRIMEG